MVQDQFTVVGAGIRESSSILFRLREKLSDKFFWSNEDISEAQQALQFLEKTFQEHPLQAFKPYFGKILSPEKIKRFKRGFHTKSITFETESATETKKWVLKIGHRISPVIDLGDPSDYQYFVEYQQDLELLQTYCQKHTALSSFIPNPQTCLWMGEKEKPGKIVILQPFLAVSPLRKTLRKLSPTEKNILREELEAIKILQKLLLKKHKKQFDFMGEDNVVLVKEGETYHFTLLDLGLINISKPLPITQLVMQISYDMTMAKLQQTLDARR